MSPLFGKDTARAMPREPDRVATAVQTRRKERPFGWNGVVCLWNPFVIFGAWLALIVLYQKLGVQ
jgi:hypothetical protein